MFLELTQPVSHEATYFRSKEDTALLQRPPLRQQQSANTQSANTKSAIIQSANTQSAPPQPSQFVDKQGKPVADVMAEKDEKLTEKEQIAQLVLTVEALQAQLHDHTRLAKDQVC